MLHKKWDDWLFRLALAVNIGMALSYLGLGIIAARQGLLWRADFTAFYTGGAIVRDGLGKQLYDYDLQTRYQQALLGGASFQEGLLPFYYPPHGALLFAPLTYFSLSTAFGIWTLCQAGLLLWLMRNLWRLSVRWQYRERWLFLSGVLAFLPLLFNILLGAFSLLVLNCILGWYLSLKRGRENRAGLWIASGSFKPQTIAMPGLVLLFARRWRAVIAMALSGVIILAICAIVLGPGIWLEFLRALRSSASFFDEYGVNPSSMYNLKGTLAIWLGKENAGLVNAISMGSFLISIGIIAWLWRGPWQPEKPDFELRTALTLTLSLFLSLHVNPHDGLLLICPAALFYEYLRRETLPRRAYGIFLWACLPLFLLAEFAIKDQIGIRLPVLAMLVLLAWQALALRKRSTSGAKVGT